MDDVIVMHEEGFVDLSLPVSVRRESEDGGSDKNFWVLDVKGSLHGVDVGFGMKVRKEVKPGLVYDKEGQGTLNPKAAAKDGVTLFLGTDEARKLRIAMAKLYDVDLGQPGVADELQLSSIALHDEDLPDWDDQMIAFELTHGSEKGKDADRHFKLLMNLDLCQGFVMLREQDIEFREAVIRALGPS